MASIGIIANPASGKDIRRLVSYATTIDNNEKVNICKRIVLAAQALGVNEIFFMPDTFMIGYAVLDSLESDRVLCSKISVLDFEIEAGLADTVRSAKLMEELKVGCIIVLGGDGTSRAAAKSICTTPMISVSTGTNNVYPTMMEGTVVGMAAAAVALMEDPYSCCIHDKRLEISINGFLRDIALIDGVLSDDLFAGAKAIWDPCSLRFIAVSRCHPATIGFSSVAGAINVVEDTDDYGFAVTLNSGISKSSDRIVRAPIAAGVIAPVVVSNAERLDLDKPYEFEIIRPGMIALDGERELRVNPGDIVSINVSRNGPYRVNTRKALELAVQLGMFEDKYAERIN
ncbi:MAG: ATP-NAD kinase [Ruminococcaceae bacterium]|nr:ATP-NAD kinase [Oscillospiraceae bacterium]